MWIDGGVGEMSREVKFRAWDKQNKQMVYGIEETYDGLPYSELNEKVELDIYNHMSCFSSWLCGDYEVMQYTGLKDKNGVRIYEGDILFHPLQGKRKVFYPYSETVASYGLRNVDNGMGSTLQDAHRVWGIVGNIYENPELLKGSAE